MPAVGSQLPVTRRERIIRFLVRRVRAFLPKNRWGDNAFAYLECLTTHGRRLPKRKPAGFSDHLLALRTGGTLYDPLSQFVTDKEYCKHYVESRVGAQHAIPTHQVLRTPHDVDALVVRQFPCVIKPTSGSGVVRICHSAGDIPSRQTLRRWPAYDCYAEGREPNYRNLRQKILIEEFISQDGFNPTTEYLVFCFRGAPGFVEVLSGHFTSFSCTSYDLNWQPLPVAVGYPLGTRREAKPPMLAKILDLATRLAAPFDFVRVDCYATDTQVWIGELTLCPGRARSPVSPPAAQTLLGRFFTSP